MYYKKVDNLAFFVSISIIAIIAVIAVPFMGRLGIVLPICMTIFLTR